MSWFGWNILSSAETEELPSTPTPERSEGYFVEDVVIVHGNAIKVPRTLEPKTIKDLVGEPRARAYLNYALYKEGVGVTDVFPLLPEQELIGEQRTYVDAVWRKWGAKLIQRWAEEEVK